MISDTHGHLASEARRRGINWEYRTYFAAILLMIALPIALLKWTAGFFQPRASGPNPGVMQRALSEARIITNMIFST